MNVVVVDASINMLHLALIRLYKNSYKGLSNALYITTIAKMLKNIRIHVKKNIRVSYSNINKITKTLK
jgi:hypothetical protein